MAYIYRYQLRDLALRDSVILTQYSQDIESVLSKHFKQNLKDIFIDQKFFEFKLYATVSKGMLQEMGRKLKSNISLQSDKYGFIRMEQTLYALVYSPREESEDNSNGDNIHIHIEFIDSILLDDIDLYMLRANSFFSNFDQLGLLREKGYVNNIEQIIKNNYIDILDAYMDKNSIPELLKTEKEKSCFLVKGFHRHVKAQSSEEKYLRDSMLLLEKCFDAGYVENRENIDRIDGAINSDYIEIYSSEECPENIEKIEKELGLLLSATKEINTLSNIAKINGGEIDSKCVFRVHNVGQALATSLSYDNHSPFLYFDYGMPFGKNRFTKPASVNMTTNPGSTIIISHVDKDHWFRIADDFNAYQCNWFIPDQPRKNGLNHKLAEIIVHGGSVQLINTDIFFQGGRITYSGVSRINPTRPARNVHETGLSLRLETHDSNGNTLNILVAGDQRYDYIDLAQLNDLDVLVASHHGGTYCWSVSGNVPNAKTESSIVIYSYGMGNTHRHPSNTAVYCAANWRQQHHTSLNSDFQLKISF